jgi:hypothetical protein
VRWACLTVTTYDSQCEGGRGWYLHQAATLAGEADSILADVVVSFARCRPDDWRFDYLSDILVRFAMEGSGSARNALWDGYHRLMGKFARTVRADAWWSSVSTLEGVALNLVLLDGWDAAQAAITGFGAGLALGPADPARPRWQYFPDWFDSSIRRRFGAEIIDDFLVGETSPAVSAYSQTAAMCGTKPWRGVASTPEPTVEALRAVIEQARRGEMSWGSLRAASMHLVRRRDPAYAQQVAAIGLDEPDPDLKAAILWAFRTRTFPLPDDGLAPLVDSEHDKLRLVVRLILGQRVADWKRTHALGLLKRGERVDEAIGLLQASYLPEDEPVVDAAIRRVSLRSADWHPAFSGVIDLLKPQDRPTATRVLEYIYRQTMCSNCRQYTIELMRDKHVLSDQIAQECRWDANAAIRDLADAVLTTT